MERIICCILIWIAYFAADNEAKLKIERTYPKPRGTYMAVVRPGVVAFDFSVQPALNFGPVTPMTPRRLLLVPGDPLIACSPLRNDVRGAVVLVIRGSCPFITKVRMAKLAGARAAIVTDNIVDDDDVIIDMVKEQDDMDVNLHSYFLHGRDGEILLKTMLRLKNYGMVIDLPVNISTVADLNLPPWVNWSY